MRFILGWSEHWKGLLTTGLPGLVCSFLRRGGSTSGQTQSNFYCVLTEASKHFAVLCLQLAVGCSIHNNYMFRKLILNTSIQLLPKTFKWQRNVGSFKCHFSFLHRDFTAISPGHIPSLLWYPLSPEVPGWWGDGHVQQGGHRGDRGSFHHHQCKEQQDQHGMEVYGSFARLLVCLYSGKSMPWIG